MGVLPIVPPRPELELDVLFNPKSKDERPAARFSLTFLFRYQAPAPRSASLIMAMSFPCVR